MIVYQATEITLDCPPPYGITHTEPEPTAMDPESYDSYFEPRDGMVETFSRSSPIESAALCKITYQLHCSHRSSAPPAWLAGHLRGKIYRGYPPAKDRRGD